jgi:hypothetical protein
MPFRLMHRIVPERRRKTQNDGKELGSEVNIFSAAVLDEGYTRQRLM